MEGTHRKPSHISQTVTEPLNNNNSHSKMQHQQQHEAQKVGALKKVYAEVILNTGKEAAARVMASERRAVQYRHELESMKDEALRMLMRLKQMLDAKTAEAEAASLNQQRKIEELEAQLNEAEDVITDLRAELNQVWLELEKTKNSQVQSSDGQYKKQNASFEESVNSETLASSPNEELECATNCDVKNRSPTVNVLDDKCCNSTKQTEQLCISNLENNYAHDPDFASIIMRSKEPELSKNGCTQRVRALEGKLLDEKLLKNLNRDEHNQHVGIKNGLIVKDSDRQLAKLSAPSTRTEKMEMKKNVKCHSKPKRKVFSYCRSCFLSSRRVHINEKCKSNKGACSLPSIKHCAICKWKGKNRHVRMGSSVSEHHKPSFVLKKCTSYSGDGKHSNDENVAKTKPVSPLTDIEPVYGSTNVTESDQVVSKSELVEKAIEKDNELLNLEGSTSQKLTGPSSSMKVEIVDVPCTNPNLEKPKAFEENDGSPSRADNPRLLKYTFQRKRKKESLGNTDEQPEFKSTSKRRVEEIHSDVLEPQKSSMIDEPSRDCQHLAQVAHQLLSLSEDINSELKGA